MSATSRIRPNLVSVLEQGCVLTKRTAATAGHCDERTAQRYLMDMHYHGIARVCGWEREHGSAIPKYIKYDGKPDAKKPTKLTTTERRRKDQEVRAKEAFNKRAKRSAEKALSGQVRIGFWGL